MIFSEDMLDSLRRSVKERLSEGRFIHTLGVEKMAARLADYCLPEEKSSLRAAALLHDIAKELDTDDVLSAIEADGFSLTRDDMQSKAILHSFAAPYIIKREFPDFTDENILSSTRNHTVGAPGMSVFDQIIFISDFIEEGRRYESSIQVRDLLLPRLKDGKREENQKALAFAVYESLRLTERHLSSTGRFINQRMILTKKYFSGK